MARSFALVTAGFVGGAVIAVVVVMLATPKPPPPAVPPTQYQVVKREDDYFAVVELVRVTGGYAVTFVDKDQADVSRVEVEFADGTHGKEPLSTSNLADLKTKKDGQTTTVAVKLNQRPASLSKVKIKPVVHYLDTFKNPGVYDVASMSGDYVGP